MHIDNPYQTVRLPNKIITGLYPSLDWFNKTSSYVDFTNKTVLDLGTCYFSYGVEALRAGAKHVVGVENDLDKIEICDQVIAEWGFSEEQAYVYYSDIESLQHAPVDITIFGMVMHWLKEPEFTVKRLFDQSKVGVFFYRYPRGQEEVGFRPTVQELGELLSCCYISGDLQYDDTQHIMMAIYDKDLRH